MKGTDKRISPQPIQPLKFQSNSLHGPPPPAPQAVNWQPLAGVPPTQKALSTPTHAAVDAVPPPATPPATRPAKRPPHHAPTKSANTPLATSRAPVRRQPGKLKPSSQLNLPRPQPKLNLAPVLRWVKSLAPRPRALGWPVFWMVVLGTSAGIGSLALLLLTALPPVPECHQLSPLASDSDRLYCAREAVRSGDLSEIMAALKLVQSWPPSHPLYKETRHLMANWSDALLAVASQRIEQSDLEGALVLARTVPPSSPSYEKAQQAIAAWQSEWQQGERIVAQALAALRQQNWTEAAAYIQELGQLENEYWRTQKSDQLTRQIWDEKSAWQNLRRARRLAKGGDRDSLVKAIGLVRQIDPSTQTWAEAKTDLQTWSQSVMELALKRWQQGDLQDAMQLAQAVPYGLDLPAEAQDLIRLSYASQQMAQQGQDTPSLKRITQLMEAIAALRQITPQSSFYAQAQAHLQTWQAHLQDLNQLQLASAIASLGQEVTYNLAIAQAQTIDPSRPQYSQAQTLMARWARDIERLQDMPYLVRAQRLAAPGTIAALQAAIAAARTVPQQRALWQDAQAAIANWTARIQSIEDQPILDAAKALAAKGELRNAIRTARKIDQNRALYAQAKAAMDEWQAEIDRVESAEDQKILDQATAQASRGRLTLAIDIASRIGPGRPLYSQARSAISQWAAERDAIWDSWAAQDAAPVDSYDPNVPQ